mmetsp:Transcript_25418/g.55006  ORF Transcript_25418/g.55006 Transcript_25418/m.55006 type:complete len:147 (+) Transcript_25418:37-477(+)
MIRTVGRLAHKASLPGLVPALSTQAGALNVSVAAPAAAVTAARMQPAYLEARHHSVLAATTTTTKPAVEQFHILLRRQMGNKACLKTNKAAAARFRVRGSGSVKRNKAGNRHNTGYKANDRKSRLQSSDKVKGKSIEKRMRRLIGA